MSASKSNFPNEVENAGLGHGDIVRMDAERARRFARELSKLSDEVHSLGSAASHFPTICLSPGEMQPALTVSAFVSAVGKRIDLLSEMVACEEDLDETGGAQ
ncbi:MAG TPA: hypothetical protein VFF81_01770 [Noviherbaspirillum sp.]|nr:hypothetical protein [Noviherbaspirillum sp.]